MVGEGGKRKRGERGWGGRAESTHQFVQSSLGTPGFSATNRKGFLLHYCYDWRPLQHEPAPASERRLVSEVCLSACSIKRKNRERTGRVGARIAGYYR